MIHEIETSKDCYLIRTEIPFTIMFINILKRIKFKS